MGIAIYLVSMKHMSVELGIYVNVILKSLGGINISINTNLLKENSAA